MAMTENMKRTCEDKLNAECLKLTQLMYAQKKTLAKIQKLLHTLQEADQISEVQASGLVNIERGLEQLDIYDDQLTGQISTLLERREKTTEARQSPQRESQQDGQLAEQQSQKCRHRKEQSAPLHEDHETESRTLRKKYELMKWKLSHMKHEMEKQELRNECESLKQRQKEVECALLTLKNENLMQQVQTQSSRTVSGRSECSLNRGDTVRRSEAAQEVERLKQQHAQELEQLKQQHDQDIKRLKQRSNWKIEKIRRRKAIARQRQRNQEASESSDQTDSHVERETALSAFFKSLAKRNATAEATESDTQERIAIRLSPRPSPQMQTAESPCLERLQRSECVGDDEKCFLSTLEEHA